MAVPFSILDLSPVAEGSDVRQSLDSSRRMAEKAEERGYKRFWLAEHHGMPGIASAATAVVIGHVGAATSRIRVGSGGIMLPNHSALHVVEAFRVLEALHPGRMVSSIGSAVGVMSFRRRVTSTDDSANPTTPPSSDRTTPSHISCRTRRKRLAPTDSRISTIRRRDVFASAMQTAPSSVIPTMCPDGQC